MFNEQTCHDDFVNIVILIHMLLIKFIFISIFFFVFDNSTALLYNTLSIYFVSIIFNCQFG